MYPADEEREAALEAKMLSDQYNFIAKVTDPLPKLAAANFDDWLSKWQQEAPRLKWDDTWLRVTGPPFDFSAETVVIRTRRILAAQMLLRTISKEHDEWLRGGTDLNNPQAIFRRMSLFFRGNNVLAVKAKYVALLHSTTQSSSNTNVVNYGGLMKEIGLRLRDLDHPVDPAEHIHLYLLGLNKPMDHIRFDIEARMHSTAHNRPRSFAECTQMVEQWAAALSGRNLLTARDTTRPGSKEVTVQTLLADPTPAIDTMLTTTARNDDCRLWVRTGTCANHDKGQCRWVHSARRKGINKPTPRTNAAAPNALRDHTTSFCDLCKVLGHTNRWGACPTKVAAAKLATRPSTFNNSIRPSTTSNPQRPLPRHPTVKSLLADTDATDYLPAFDMANLPIIEQFLAQFRSNTTSPPPDDASTALDDG